MWEGSIGWAGKSAVVRLGTYILVSLVHSSSAESIHYRFYMYLRYSIHVYVCAILCTV